MKNVEWGETPQPKSKFQRLSITEQVNARQEAIDLAKAKATLFQQLLPHLATELFNKIQQGQPIQVLKSFAYVTEGIAADDDDGFYKVNKNTPEFKNITKTIQAGNQLKFIELEKHMNKLWFSDSEGKLVDITIGDSVGYNNLLTQTDIYPSVIKSLKDTLEEDINQ